ncbi:hypothetical protein F441_01548 [Phytophthora nicotianae CJ01A1]|uniref:RxLR effector protein n=6 Tax=Phytophthora nicotianae TaxID=4792 RepID=V9FWC1_PHYNI|nr:hypothetical protein F443_01577 [Phytophthora nicotianae P1569]ETK95584.1 hypothetical protein L915_01505 [Phytophthora nicotianae]ETP25593.1 hypothetical protein F441_01548 [Phytophthora nicotianae CJ01A1]
MRSPVLLLVLAVASLVASGSAIFINGITNRCAGEGKKGETRFLRLKDAESDKQEERALNLNFLKKMLPGTSAFKNAKTLKVAQREAAKANSAAKRKAKLDTWFSKYTRDEYLYKNAFPTWKEDNMSPASVRQYFEERGISGEVVNTIANRFGVYQREKLP